jgi:predicted Zn-dependent protease
MSTQLVMQHAVKAARVLCLSAAAFVLVACSTNPVSGKREVSLVSEADEIKLGRAADADVKKEYGVYNNPALQAYVTEVGMRLAKQSQRANLPWQFTVVDSPEINAFALPGGFIYITRGLMAYLDSEEELAGVLGHEVGHVTARHGAKRQTQGTLAQVFAVGAEILGQVYGVQGAGQIAGGVAGQMIQGYGRDQELQADQLGAQYLSANAYDPKAMIKVISVLKNQEAFASDKARDEGKKPQKMPDWGSSHPSNDQRLKEITQIAGSLKTAPSADAGRDRYLRAINGMTFGDGAAQGVIRGASFFHEPLGIAFSAPSGWKLRNSSEAVIAVNPQESAGVAMLLATGAGATHEDIIRKIFNPRSGKSEKTTVNGLPATYFQGQSANDKGQVVAVEATIIAANGQQFVMRTLSKDAAARTAAAADLAAVVRSFHVITPAERALAKPYSLRIQTLPAGQNITGLARATPIGRYAEQEMRLINGVYPTGELSAGKSIKVVVQ